MTAGDTLAYALLTLRSRPGRTALVLCAMALGVAAVVVLTALGEGARRYVSGEFASLGTHLLIVLPGRSETTGAAPALFVGVTPRDLTIGDARALSRSPAVRRVAPLILGSASAAWRQRSREVPVLGSTHSLLALRHWRMQQGRFLPVLDPELAQPVCVIGNKVRRELFGAAPALGQWLRLGERRCRVIGVLATEGRSIGLDVEELVIVPVASARALFNTPGLFRILVEARSREAIPRARAFILDTLRRRHQGEEDVTVVTQDAVLATFDRIFRALTLGLGGIAAISLTVAGVLIMNVMLITVAQRRAEIGLLKALGATRRLIQVMFLGEAALLALGGALLGLGLGWVGSRLLAALYPALPAASPPWAVAGALATALLTGLLFALLPARRAARLDPVLALTRR
ncbi:MAG TPA: ABC transporter permease [Gammaproteobacteria bacterium]|nr:ABC transporter permease [Gammaproteobacteria bacterium]